MISHPLNTNPFPGSFLNYKGRMRLVGVTMQTLTLLEFEGAFDTEHMVRPPGTRTRCACGVCAHCWQPCCVFSTACRRWQTCAHCMNTSGAVVHPQGTVHSSGPAL